MRQARILEQEDQGSLDHFGRSIRLALDGLKQHQFPVYDAKSAQEVKGIGPTLATVR